ncbi:MAG TPA: DUF2235 domain-containing protein, partial [Pseudolabrys sp.]|nr:DUF2235 domain-containing protein [Pseudolabrys sp.]
SDGTGNSAASPFKTNVWRLYQAIDIESPPSQNDPVQLVFYDDGVGTENFKPLAALGGALGIGVWKNVRDIYTFVCRNYDVGDQIYGFGFSRGAFTMRLVMGLIGKCGIVKAESEAKLVECVQMAYEAYRRDYLLRASKRRHMIYHRLLRPPKYIADENGNPSHSIDLSATGCTQVFPDIRFIGVWDTVDAYGMPVDELKQAIDERVWPMSFADRDPSDRLLTIRHALSLDDERPTFRPVLWNEVIRDHRHPGDVSKQKFLGPERIQQAWFAGVHANVGGGYPDDGLAFTSLAWMMGEAAAVGLRYNKLLHAEIVAHVNPDGKEYDSRAGIAGYYRYGPRQVGALCDDKDHDVAVPVVHLHPAAFERIVAWRRDYEPVGLDCPFSVAGATQLPADAAAMKNAWDLVWWRRVAYFVTVALSAFVTLFALRLVFVWPDYILALTEAWLGWLWSFVTTVLGQALTGWIAAGWNWLLNHIGALLPAWANQTVPSFRKYPLSGIVSLALLAWSFFIWSPRLERRIGVLAEWAWAAHKGLTATAEPGTDWHNAVARRLRPVTAFCYRRIWRGMAVPALGVAIGLVALVICSPYWIFRVRRRRPWMA